MKKLFILITISGAVFITTENTQAQTVRQLNFGIIGINYEIPITSEISVSPAAATDFELNYLKLGVRVNYYFDSLIGLPDEWDVYGGANGGFGIGLGGRGNDISFGLHAGGRWRWSDKWAVYAELGGEILSGAAGGVGLTMAL